MGKAAIVSPYLDSLGGGERYVLSFARVLRDAGYKVDIEWKNNNLQALINERFGKQFDNLNFVENVNKGDGYDICFWVSDGSIPLLHGRNNILHFQVPFKNVEGRSLLNKMKLFRINTVVCNSNFTKQIIDTEYGVDSTVIYPPVPTEDLRPKRKENIILFVGRFSNLLQNKGQECLIDSFKEMNLPSWRLILAGGVGIGTETEFISKLREKSEGFNIEIVENPNFKILKDLYGKAKIFWSASGYGVDVIKSPEKLEHFGMSIVESMAAGAVPVVFDGGGHTEIVENGENGYLWSDKNDLINTTIQLTKDKLKYKELSEKAIISSADFNYDKFRNSIIEIL